MVPPVWGIENLVARRDRCPGGPVTMEHPSGTYPAGLLTLGHGGCPYGRGGNEIGMVNGAELACNGTRYKQFASAYLTTITLAGQSS